MAARASITAAQKKDSFARNEFIHKYVNSNTFVLKDSRTHTEKYQIFII